MWPGFKSRRRRHIWVEFVVGSLPCYEGFFPGTSVFSSPQKLTQSTLSKTDTLGTGTKCPSYKESNKGSKERQGPTISVCFTEVSIL